MLQKWDPHSHQPTSAVSPPPCETEAARTSLYFLLRALLRNHEGNFCWSGMRINLQLSSTKVVLLAAHARPLNALRLAKDQRNAEIHQCCSLPNNCFFCRWRFSCQQNQKLLFFHPRHNSHNFNGSQTELVGSHCSAFRSRLDCCSAHGVYLFFEGFNSFLPIAPQLSECQVKERWQNHLAC